MDTSNNKNNQDDQPSSGLAGFRLRWSRRLQFRMAALFLGLLLLVQLASFVVIGGSVERNARASIRQELTASERVLLRLLAQDAAGLAGAAAPDAARSREMHEMRSLLRLHVAMLVRAVDGKHTSRWQVMQHSLDAAQAAALQGRLASDAAPAVPASGALPELMRLGRDTFDGRLVALADNGTQQVSALLLRSVDEAVAPYRRLQWMLLALTLAGVLLFALGSVLTVRRITTPLSALTRSAWRLGKGDYEAAVEVKSPDEIGELAQAFEHMRLAMREREGEIRRLAFRDTLTHLPNREQFRADLREAIQRANRHGIPCSILMLDLDRFKHVNDVLGHRFGDRLLCQVALRLAEEAQRGPDVVARLGGDEFAVLLNEADAKAAQRVAERVLRVFDTPLRLDDHTVDLGTGIGIASCPSHGIEADLLMSRAEIAMYSAKTRQAGIVVYEPALDSTSDESLSLLSELRRAVDREQLRLYLQPKVALHTGEVVGAEALVRWQHPTRGLVAPLSFIPFAERTGFIRVLTGWMIERGAAALQQLHAEGRLLKLSINLSTRDLLDQDLAPKLEHTLRQHSMDPSMLCLEITESAIMDDPQRALATLERLHGMGLKLSIDDFGTGYSSLAYLKRLPVDELKIDKSFVLSMERDLDDAKIVRSTVDLAHNLGLSVVAEGVENAKAWTLLEGLRCDEAQGFFIAQPMPHEQFGAWVKRWLPPQRERLDTDFAALV